MRTHCGVKYVPKSPKICGAKPSSPGQHTLANGNQVNGDSETQVRTSQPCQTTAVMTLTSLCTRPQETPLPYTNTVMSYPPHILPLSISSTLRTITFVSELIPRSVSSCHSSRAATRPFKCNYLPDLVTRLDPREAHSALQGTEQKLNS